MNHTLAGEPIPSKEVVTRNRWGTPMLPDRTSGYSIIQPIVPEYIARSLVQPPVSGDASLIFRPGSNSQTRAADATQSAGNQ